MLALLAAQLVSLRAQVGGLQAQIDAMAATIEAAMDQQQPAAPVECAHLETENVGTFGAPERRCMTCKKIV